MINPIKAISKIWKPEDSPTHPIMQIIINVAPDRIELQLRTVKNPKRKNLKRSLSVSLWMMCLSKAEKWLNAMNALSAFKLLTITRLCNAISVRLSLTKNASI